MNTIQPTTAVPLRATLALSAPAQAERAPGVPPQGRSAVATDQTQGATQVTPPARLATDPVAAPRGAEAAVTDENTGRPPQIANDGQGAQAPRETDARGLAELARGSFEARARDETARDSARAPETDASLPPAAMAKQGYEAGRVASADPVAPALQRAA